MFILQISIPLLFTYKVGFENFQPLNRNTTFLRIISVILITLAYSKELYTSIKMLTYLKRIKGFSVKKKKIIDNNRLVCVGLSMMQITVPFITVLSLILKVTQEEQAG